MSTLGKKTKQVLRQVTPPVLLGAINKLRHTIGGQSSGPPHGEKSADWYDEYYAESEEYRKPFYQSVYYPLWSVIVDRIQRYEFESINDIGCGAGQFAEMLRFHGVERYRGLDLSSEAIGIAKLRNPHFQFEARDVLASPPDDLDEFDCTVSLEFLEHVNQDLDVMANLPSGHHFIGSVPNFPFISHVRHFKDEEEVAARYGVFFKELAVSSHMGNREGKLFFLLDGVIGEPESGRVD